jgi:Ras family protein A
MCFSVDNPVSAASVVEKWTPEIRHFCGKCPVILVACKIDLRTDARTIGKLKAQGEKPVTTEAGKQIAAQIKADSYMECSAKTREGVQELFVTAARLSFKKHNKRKKEKNCNLF